MSTIKTDGDEFVVVSKDEHGDVEIEIVHGIQSCTAILRPTQAERLANALLLTAGYDEFDLTGHTSMMKETPNGREALIAAQTVVDPVVHPETAALIAEALRRAYA